LAPTKRLRPKLAQYRRLAEACAEISSTFSDEDDDDAREKEL